MSSSGPKDLGQRDRNVVPNGKSPLGAVRGRGSAHAGGEHWIKERVSSIALLLLGFWLIASLLMLPAYDQATFVDWLRSPWVAVPMALFVYVAFEHSYEGLKVVIDDYQGDEGGRMFWTVISLFFHVALGATALFALARIVFGAAQ
ncbi:succinate dehydrogenase, hydrophobic membrane anchor protein [Sphingomonas ginkgonis]|uniref:Succinate dehydrogenase hydrophobic membrane anchor subunit n=1 Tax=Sphingomonas ginkgonis TaxID=2315330 RepID=A0A429V7N8_9SPHN|nr:succinate dehydrogenase, hydrophobic membrane anchor protein [Sphingomonas ginkgonis]RST29955.1 succinate dehydrogenase, hydrophobic membrane anchor protein [Sphingomonas ginkgonis]